MDVGRLDLPDKRRDEDEPHPEDFDLRFGISPAMREKINTLKAGRRGSGQQAHVSSRARTFSERRLQILKLVAHGKSNPEIARELILHVETVKSHCRDIYDLLGARNRAHAVAIAYERGLLPHGTVASGKAEAGR